jgi:hypothetical protein
MHTNCSNAGGVSERTNSTLGSSTSVKVEPFVWDQPIDPDCLDDAEKETLLYNYGLIKRPGWKNRRVDEVTYCGDCGYEHKVSLDINSIELRKHLEKFKECLGKYQLSSEQIEDRVRDASRKIPIGELEKKSLLYDLDLRNAQGTSQHLLARHHSYLMEMSILQGCLLKYHEMQKEYRALSCNNQASSEKKKLIDENYPELSKIFQEEQTIMLPSPQMLKILEQCVTAKDVSELAKDGAADPTIDDLFKFLENEMARLTDIEKETWGCIEKIYEFKVLLHTYTICWLPLVELDPLTTKEDTLLKLRYAKIIDLFASIVFKPRKRRFLIALLLSLVLSWFCLPALLPIFDALFGTVLKSLEPGFLQSHLPDLDPLLQMIHPALAHLLYNGLAVSQTFLYPVFAFLLEEVLPVLVYLIYLGIVATSFYFLFSSHLVRYGNTIFGCIVEWPMNRIGSAETEHFTFRAPDGTVIWPLSEEYLRSTSTYCPSLIGKFKKRLPIYWNWFFAPAKRKACDMLCIFDASCSSDASHAIAEGSLTPEHVALRTQAKWNTTDLQGILSDTGEPGHQSGQLPYKKEENHTYKLPLLMAPKLGKRALSFALTPLVILAALIIMNLINLLPSKTEVEPDVLSISSSALVALASVIGPGLYSSSEEEPFIRRRFSGLSRAFWRLSVAIALIGPVFMALGGPESWTHYFKTALLLLVPLSLFSGSWYLIHFRFGKWLNKYVSPKDKTEGCLTNKFKRVEVIFCSRRWSDSKPSKVGEDPSIKS